MGCSHGRGLVGMLTLALITAGSPEPSAQPLRFDALAGAPSSIGAIDGSATTSRFAMPQGLAVDSSGNVYVADANNDAIRRISPAGEVTTLAGVAGLWGHVDARGGAARLASPWGIALDATGNLLVAEYINGGVIRKVDPSGRTTTVAGLFEIAGAADGQGLDARFNGPMGIAVDDVGNVYVSDYFDCTIRKIDPGGFVTTLAGQAGNCVDADGVGPAASFGNPVGLAFDPGSRSLFVADTFDATIRRIDLSNGTVSTFAGTAGSLGSTDGNGAAAQFLAPWMLARDSAGNLYVTDELDHTIRMITPAADVTTLAGSSGVMGTANGVGAAATFTYPGGIAFDPTTGGLVVTDSQANDLRRISLPGAVVSRLAGIPGGSGSRDGTGTSARFGFPGDVARDGATFYVADTSNNTIRSITSGGLVSTLAGRAGQFGSTDGTGATARLGQPWALTVDEVGAIFVADRGNSTIRQVSASGVVTTWAGQAGMRGATDGNGTSARFRFAAGVASDRRGNVYVADSGNSTIRMIDAGQNVTTVAGLARTPGSVDGVGGAARFVLPLGIAADSAGNVYVADNRTIRKIAPGAIVTTIAGRPGVPGHVDGAGSEARFGTIRNLSIDASGNILVASGNAIRQVTPAGVVTTLAGGAGRPLAAMCSGRDARFGFAMGVVADEAGNLVVADAGAHAVWRSVPALDDVATIDSTIGSVGAMRQLDTQPQSATTWQWDVVRRPPSSTATLSSRVVRDPTFAPDQADLFVFECAAANAPQSSTTLAWVSSAKAPVITAASTRPARASEGQTVVFMVQDLEAPVEVHFSDGVSPAVTATSVLAEVARGVVAVKVPAGARTGNLRLSSGGVDAPPYWFRVEPTPFVQGSDVVSGVVGIGGSPVPGALLALEADIGCGELVIQDVAITDAAGSYSMRGPDGDHVVSVLAPVGAGVMNMAVPVTLGPIPVTRDFALVPGTTVRGTVVDGMSGAGLRRCRVSFTDGVVRESVLTDGNGAFSAELAPGDWIFRAVPPLGVACRRHEETLTVAAVGPQDVPPVVLDRGVIVRGLARRAADSSPLSSAEVSSNVTPACCPEVDRAVVGGDGVYTLVVPANQAYDVQLQLDGHALLAGATIPVTVATASVEQGLLATDASLITGTITEAGTGLPLGCVEVVARAFPWPGAEVSRATTCSDGTYSLRVPPGASYLVSTRMDASAGCAGTAARASQSWNGTPSGTWFPCEGAPVAVGAISELVAGIDFVLPLAAGVNGSFFTQASGCASTTSAVGASNVTIDDGVAHACGMGLLAATPAGTYSVALLPPSTVTTLRACVSPPPPYQPQCWNGHAPPAFDGITVAPGGSAVADFCLGAGAADPTRPITGLRVRKGGTATILITWDASIDPDHLAYRVRGAATATPSILPGAYPTDPAFGDLTARDADASNANTSLSLALPASESFFLVTDTGPTADGPSESYGD